MRRCARTRGSRRRSRLPRPSGCWGSGGASHPDVVVTTLRTAPVVGPGAERLPARLLLGRPTLRVQGAAPPVQAVHVDDLVAALELVVREDLPASSTSRPTAGSRDDDLRALSAARSRRAMPADALTRVLRATWSLGIGEIPPGVVPYLVHPWVIANDRLRALGWQPEHTNEQSILDGVASLPAPRRHARAVAFATGAAAGAGVAAYVTGRQVRRQVRKSRAR